MLNHAMLYARPSSTLPVFLVWRFHPSGMSHSGKVVIPVLNASFRRSSGHRQALGSLLPQAQLLCLKMHVGDTAGPSNTEKCKGFILLKNEVENSADYCLGCFQQQFSTTAICTGNISSEN